MARSPSALARAFDEARRPSDDWAVYLGYKPQDSSPAFEPSASTKRKASKALHRGDLDEGYPAPNDLSASKRRTPANLSLSASSVRPRRAKPSIKSPSPPSRPKLELDLPFEPWRSYRSPSPGSWVSTSIASELNSHTWSPTSPTWSKSHAGHDDTSSVHSTLVDFNASSSYAPSATLTSPVLGLSLSSPSAPSSASTRLSQSVSPSSTRKSKVDRHRSSTTFVVRSHPPTAHPLSPTSTIIEPGPVSISQAPSAAPPSTGTTPRKPAKPSARTSATPSPARPGTLRAAKESRTPRPPNAWILYRSDQLKVIRDDPVISKKPQADISKLIAALWREEKSEVKLWYEQQADIRKLEHLRQFPDYRFSPQRRDKKDGGSSTHSSDVTAKLSASSNRSRSSSPIRPTGYILARPPTPPSPAPSMMPRLRSRSPPPPLPSLPPPSPLLASSDHYINHYPPRTPPIDTSPALDHSSSDLEALLASLIGAPQVELDRPVDPSESLAWDNFFDSKLSYFPHDQYRPLPTLSDPTPSSVTMVTSASTSTSTSSDASSFPSPFFDLTSPPSSTDGVSSDLWSFIGTGEDLSWLNEPPPVLAPQPIRHKLRRPPSEHFAFPSKPA